MATFLMHVCCSFLKYQRFNVHIVLPRALNQNFRGRGLAFLESRAGTLPTLMSRKPSDAGRL